jgi:hypothetical protein
MAKELAIRDKKIKQLENHMESLNELLTKNSRLIEDKAKTNKYLLKVKHKFKEYDETMNNIKIQQIESLELLKKYLLLLKNNSELNEDEKQNIDYDLRDIDSELKKII